MVEGHHQLLGLSKCDRYGLHPELEKSDGLEDQINRELQNQGDSTCALRRFYFHSPDSHNWKTCNSNPWFHIRLQASSTKQTFMVVWSLWPPLSIRPGKRRKGMRKLHQIVQTIFSSKSTPFSTCRCDDSKSTKYQCQPKRWHRRSSTKSTCQISYTSTPASTFFAKKSYWPRRRSQYRPCSRTGARSAGTRICTKSGVGSRAAAREWLWPCSCARMHWPRQSSYWYPFAGRNDWPLSSTRGLVR